MQNMKPSSEKTVEKGDKLHARKAKLEHVSHDISVVENPQDNLKNLYRSIMENTYIGITLIDLDYKILMFNNMVRLYSHKPADELVGRECFREFEKRDSICPHCPGRKAIITGQPAEIETEGVHDDGSCFQVRIQAFPAMKSDGTVTGFIEIIEDITERKKAEQAFRESEERYRTLVETAPDVIYNIAEDGTFVSLNSAFEKITGWSRNEWLGKYFAAIVHPDDLSIAIETFQRTLRGKAPPPYELRILSKSGEYLVGEFTSTPHIAGSKVVGEFGIVRDITERKTSEHALRESEARYRALIESQIDLISRYLPDTTLTFVNDAYCQFYGKTREELIGHSFLSMVAPEFHELVMKETKNMVNDPRPIAGEYLNYRHDGRECWIQWVIQGIVNENGRVIELQAVGRDITRLKQTEQILRQREEKYRDLYENAPNGYFSVNNEGRIGYCNRYLVEMLGYNSVNEIVGIPVEDLYADTIYGKSKVLQILQDVRAEGTMRDEELQMQKRNGTAIWVGLTINAERDDEGQFRWMHSMVVNITKRKQAEQKLLDYQSQLKSLASQLTLAEERERRRIAIEMHDRIGQSLAIAKVKLDGLRHSISIANPTTTLEEVCHLLGQAITDVRSLTFDLSSPILNELGFEAAVAAWLTEEIEQKHNIMVELEDDKKFKTLDNDIGAILFRNVRELLINVVKHSQATKVKVTIASVGSMISIGVEDNGVGFIPAEVMAKAVRKGGFGLFSIRERLEQLGGHLEIKSAPGCGCKVEMMAP
ncbi:MAG: hypothetical protein A2167_08330 [Planctomycetes bacterium RBG_13_46_10]|nr:MAG: hypothetical protein A2167_08330 [Planctomycetes bacterium RBG_13_46_10]